MKIYDFEQVAATLAPLKAKFADCAHGEGSTCETLDAHLACCAKACFEVVLACREWAQGVFHGQVLFDPAAENTWRSELAMIHVQATRMWHLGRAAEVPCWELPGQNMLGSALQELQWLADSWVTPRPSVGPIARVTAKLNDEQRAAVRTQLGTLPPLDRAGTK